MGRGSIPLIVTDGYVFYERVVREVFGPVCLYGQVIKTRRNDRVVKVERTPVIGAKWRFAEARAESEDSSTLNTSFIERLNRTMRRLRFRDIFLWRESLFSSKMIALVFFDSAVSRRATA